MKYYHNLYLKCDVPLVADVFEKFRNNSLKSYGLSTIHYFNAPALSWDAMFNMTKVELELIAYADMYLFFEKYMRSVVSYVSKKFSKADNKYLKSYDPNKIKKY